MAKVEQEDLEIRLRAFCDYVDSLIERTDQGGYQFSTTDEFVRAVGGNFVFGREYFLPDNLHFHQLSRQGLIHIAKYLSDAIIKPSAAIVTTFDHLRYWGWTAAVAGQVFQNADNEEIALLKSDFQNTIHLGLFPLRADMNSGNPTVDAINSDSERLALISGLSVLEGFICHLGNSLTAEGRTRRTIRASWKPTDSDGAVRAIGNGSEVHNYHDILQIWLNYDANTEVAKVLSDINDLTRYEQETLDWKFDDVIDILQRERKDGTHNFLTVLSKHRDLNLHGETSTHALAPLALTLCCLYIWDSMESEEYREVSDDVMESIRWRNQTPVGTIHPLWPSAFYPV